MTVYWLLFSVVAALALGGRTINEENRTATVIKQSKSWSVVGLILVLLIGLRHQVGGDWANYQLHQSRVAGLPLSESVESGGDPSYFILNWMGANGYGDIYFVNTACAILFVWGLINFCRSQPQPWLALAVGIPYMVIVVGMGYTRQAVAIGLMMLGLVRLERGQTWLFCFWILAGATFHKSAVILLPLLLFSRGKNRFAKSVALLLIMGLAFILLLQEYVEALQRNYIELEYQSEGAAPRILMNAIPAAIFLIFNSRFAMSGTRRQFWKVMAWVAIIFLVLLTVSSASTAIDRVALYWIPLQIFVWSRLPNAFCRDNSKRQQWVLGIIAYSGTVQFTWLVFATNAPLWIPYNFYPWIAYWR